MPNAVAPIAPGVDDETARRMQRLAELKRRPLNALLGEAVHQYVEREERRAAMLKDAADAWNEYDETGLHLTASEVADWLETWGTEDEKAMPQCHR